MAELRTIRRYVDWHVQSKQSVRGKRGHGSGKPLFFQPTELKDNAKALALLLGKPPDTPLDGPLKLTLIFTLGWLAKHTPKMRACGAILCCAGQDLDNKYKQIGDVLQRAGFIANDSRIATAHITKAYTGKEGVWVCIEELDPYGCVVPPECLP